MEKGESKGFDKDELRKQFDARLKASRDRMNLAAESVSAVVEQNTREKIQDAMRKVYDKPNSAD